MRQITAESLGNEEFKREHNIKYAYTAGGTYKGIASGEMVVRMGRRSLKTPGEVQNVKWL